jgi:hypothetical protein
MILDPPPGSTVTVTADDSLRLDIASGAGEIEREWLYRVLSQRYSLPPP